MTELYQFLCFSLGLLLSNFKGHLQAKGEETQIKNFTKCLKYHPLPPQIISICPSGPRFLVLCLLLGRFFNSRPQCTAIFKEFDGPNPRFEGDMKNLSIILMFWGKFRTNSRAFFIFLPVFW